MQYPGSRFPGRTYPEGTTGLERRTYHVGVGAQQYHEALSFLQLAHAVSWCIKPRSCSHVGVSSVQLQKGSRVANVLAALNRG
jgi:hypothetical protein